MHSDELRSLRESLDISRRWLAIQCDVSLKTVENWEQNKVAIRPRHVQQLRALKERWVVPRQRGIEVLIEQLYDQEFNSDIISNAVDMYRKHYSEIYGNIELFGHARQIPLIELYVDLLFSERPYATYSLKQKLNQSDACGNATLSGQAIVARYHRLHIVGSPGAGKSVFLRRLALSSINYGASKAHDRIMHEKWSEYHLYPKIPVMVEVRSLCQQKQNIKTRITELFDNAGFPSVDNLVENGLKRGMFMLLIDGLDEADEANYERIRIELELLSRNYEDIVIITTQRYSNKYFPPKGFVQYTVRGFESDQILDFLLKWFAIHRMVEGKAIADKIYKTITKDQEMTDLATSPLILAYIACSYNFHHEIPQSKLDIIRDSLNASIFRWSREKLVHHEKLHSCIHHSLEIEMISEIAFKVHNANRDWISYDELRETITSFCSRFAVFEEEIKARTFDPDKIIDGLQTTRGMIAGISAGNYIFSHEAFRLYLAANYINSYIHVNPKIVENVLFPNWKAVYALIGGMANVNEITHNILQFLESRFRKSSAIMHINKLSSKTNLILGINEALQFLSTRYRMLDNELLDVSVPERNLGSEGDKIGKSINGAQNDLLKVISKMRLKECVNDEAFKTDANLRELFDGRQDIFDFIAAALLILEICEYPIHLESEMRGHAHKFLLLLQYPQREVAVPRGYAVIEDYHLPNTEALEAKMGVTDAD